MEKPGKPTLRAQGKAPKPNYIIIPAAGSLMGPCKALENMTTDEINSIVKRMVETYGAKRKTQ